MKIIAVINQKGGVGKTACAYNLAYNFGIKEKTLLIDLDPSGNATKGLLPNYSLKDAYTVRDFLLDKTLSQALHRVEFNDVIVKNLQVIPAKIDLALAQRDLSHKSYRELVLHKKISKLQEIENFNFIFIDCSPTLSDLTINAIFAADFILIPVTYENDALEGIADLFKVIDEIKQNGVQFKILRNQKDIRKTRTNNYIEEALSDFIVKEHVLKTIIRQDERINQAKIERKPIALFDPNSNGAQDFNLLTEELFQCLKN